MGTCVSTICCSEHSSSYDNNSSVRSAEGFINNIIRAVLGLKKERSIIEDCEDVESTTSSVASFHTAYSTEENFQEGFTSHTSGPLPSKTYSEWPNRPVFFCAHPDVRTKDYEHGASLPFGVPIDFESDLFKGKIFVRLRSVESDTNDRANQIAYFHNKKRCYQVIVQGQFKEELYLSDIMIGDYYSKPLRGVPNGFIMKLYQNFMQVLSPGIILDLVSDTPKVLNSFGSSQIMRIDLLGNEPKITGAVGNIKEDMSLLLGEEYSGPSSIQIRRRYLSNPKNSCKYKVKVDHVYTFEIYDHSIDIGTYYQSTFGGHQIDMADSMNGQALAFCLFTRDERIIYKFPIWHERLIKNMDESCSQK